MISPVATTKFLIKFASSHVKTSQNATLQPHFPFGCKLGSQNWLHQPKPISTYGASKLASEALITAYAYTNNFKAIIYRLANIVGPRSTHGVIHHFIQKLSKNPTFT